VGPGHQAAEIVAGSSRVKPSWSTFNPSGARRRVPGGSAPCSDHLEQLGDFARVPVGAMYTRQRPAFVRESAASVRKTWLDAAQCRRPPKAIRDVAASGARRFRLWPTHTGSEGLPCAADAPMLEPIDQRLLDGFGAALGAVCRDQRGAEVEASAAVANSTNSSFGTGLPTGKARRQPSARQRRGKVVKALTFRRACWGGSAEPPAVTERDSPLSRFPTSCAETAARGPERARRDVWKSH